MIRKSSTPRRDSGTETVAPTFVQEVRSPGQSLAQDDRLFLKRVATILARRATTQRCESRRVGAGNQCACLYHREPRRPELINTPSRLPKEEDCSRTNSLHVVQQRGGQTQGAFRGGQSSYGIPVASSVPMLQRDFPPHLALPTPVAQKPYYRTDEAITDLRLAAEGLSG